MSPAQIAQTLLIRFASHFANYRVTREPIVASVSSYFFGLGTVSIFTRTISLAAIIRSRSKFEMEIIIQSKQTSVWTCLSTTYILALLAFILRIVTRFYFDFSKRERKLHVDDWLSCAAFVSVPTQFPTLKNLSILDVALYHRL
jgi:hypothetical protein